MSILGANLNNSPQKNVNFDFMGTKFAVHKDEETGSVIHYLENSNNHTRQTSVDRDSDGTIDSVSYFQDDEEGRCQQSQFDFDNDSIIDETLKFVYDENGELEGRYTFEGDGTEGEIIECMNF